MNITDTSDRKLSQMTEDPKIFICCLELCDRTIKICSRVVFERKVTVLRREIFVPF